MATKAFNLTAQINVRGPSNLRVVAADIRRRLGNINVSINPVINASASRNITNLNRNLRTLNATLASTQTSATNAAAAIRGFSQAVASVSGRSINTTLTRAATSARTLATNAQAAGRNVGQAATQMEEFGRQSALAVRRFAAFSIVSTAIYGLINAVNAGTKAFIDFDKEFVRLQQVTGESYKGLRGLAGEITRLSTSLGVSSQELTTVSVKLAQAGLSANDTKKALQALARSSLAPTFDDMNNTAEGSIALMRQFGIDAGQLESALGSVNAVAAKFAVEAGDIISAVQRTGGVFAAASKGVSEGRDALNEFIAVFTSIRATTRESAETIATGLRTIFTRIQRQSTVDALEALGINLRDAQGKFVGAYKAVELLSRGLSKLDPRSGEFAAIAEELGGFRQIGKVIPLIQQLATRQDALKVAQQGQASLAKDAATAQLSLANRIAKVQEEFTALIRSIGETQSFKQFVNLALDLASALIAVADAAKNVLPAITAIAAFRGVAALSQFGRGFASRIGGGQRFATGGYVPGVGNTDTVDAKLTPGEFVINKKAAARLGKSRLQALNRADKTPGFNKGGVVQKFSAGGGVLDSAMVGMSPKDTARLQASIQKNAQAFEQLEKMVAGWPVEDVQMAMKKLDRSLEKGAKISDALSDSVRAAPGAGGATRTAKKGVLQQTAGATENRAVTNPVGPTGFAASQQRLDAIAANPQQYQRGVDIAANRTTAGGRMGGQVALSGMAQQKLAAGGFKDSLFTKLKTSASQGAASVAKFAGSVKAAPMATFNKSLSMAGKGLMSVGKRGLVAGGRGLSAGIGRLGGGAIKAGKAAVGNMSGMGGMMLAMVGGMAVDSVSKAFGGEDTEAGRTISAVGSNTLNMASTGAMIGSMFGPLGTAIGGAAGALVGLTMGFMEAEKANEEYVQAQKKAASDAAMEKSGKAIEKFAQTGNKADRAAAMSAFMQSSAKEAEFGAGVKRKGAGFFTSEENLKDFAKRKAETQKAGAQQAEQFLAASMIQSGKTFQQLSKSMNPAEFDALATNVAEADETYAYFQAQRAKEIEELRASGRMAEADALQAQTNEEQKELARNIAERKLKEAEAAAQATKAANASKALAITMKMVALSLQKAFDATAQALNKVSFQVEDASANIDEIASGQVGLVSRSGDRAANILANPQAYSEQERRAAMSRGAQIMGPMGGEAMRIAEAGPRIQNEAIKIAAMQQARGGVSAKESGNTIKEALRKQIEDTFGVGSPMAQTAINDMQKKIDDAVEKAGSGPLDVQAVVTDAMAPITQVSEQAAKTIQQANEVVSKNLEALGKAAQKVAEIEQKRIARTSALQGMQAESRISEAEALGARVSVRERAEARATERAGRVGISPAGYGAAALVDRRQQLIQQQQMLTTFARQAEQQAPTDPKAARNLVEFNTRLAAVNATLEDVDQQLEDLPQLLESQIGDVIGEIQKRASQLGAQREAGAGLAEKIVTSTPQELNAMSNTYQLMNNTLKGNITTINQSQAAQKAYFDALRSGKSAQEAMNDAQSAFAQENKKALDMFNEMAQVAGIQGPEMDRMRADLIANFAKATGQQNNPFIQKIVSELRKDPAERAAQDPIIQAQRKMLEDLRDQQAAAVAEANEIGAQKQADILDKGTKPIIAAFTRAGQVITQAVDRLAAATGTRPFASGGMVYASKGQLINFKPKGTDTVPAMLTPGEFVVNRQATRKNLGLLRAINSGQGSNGNYALGGTVNSGTPTLDQNTINRAVSNNINQFQNTLNRVDKNTGETNQTLKKEVSESRLFNSGGIVYASKGTLARGTDTVPAMLTPGEFVVNRKATKNNLGLLKAINGGTKGYSKGGTVYLAGGGLIGEGEAANERFYKQAMADAQSKSIWLGVDKQSLEALWVVRNHVMASGITVRDYMKNGIEGSDLMYVSNPDARAATVAIKEKYPAFDPKKHRLYPLSKYLEKEYKTYKESLSKNPKEKNANVLNTMYEREMAMYPKLFQDESYTREAPTPEEEFENYLADPAKRQRIYNDLRDRYNFLNLLYYNNKQASRTHAMEYKPMAQAQMARADDEIKAMNTFFSKLRGAFAGVQEPQNRFAQSRLFDPNDRVVGMKLGTIVSQAYNRGGVVYASKGQLINFASKGTDTVPAMLTPGEFVVNRKAAKQNTGLLQAINSNNYSKGGPVYLRRGGQPRRSVANNNNSAQAFMQPAELQVSQDAKDFLTTLTTKIDGFGQYVDKLANINIPDRIDLNITAQPIEVRITGAAAFENMSEGIQNMIVAETNKKMGEIWGQTGGELGTRPA